jgi:hypothetical protein
MGIADERQFFAMAAQRGVAPSDDWLARKTGKSVAEARTQYFNDAMARLQTRGGVPQGKYQEAMREKYTGFRFGEQPDYDGYNRAMSDYRAGKPQAIARPGDAQSIQTRAPSLPPGTTAADIQQSYNARMEAQRNAPPPWMQPATQAPVFTERPWQQRR